MEIYAEENSRELKGIKEEIDRLTKEEELYIKRQSQLKREIEIYGRDRDEYLAKQKEQESLLQKFGIRLRGYIRGKEVSIGRIYSSRFKKAILPRRRKPLEEGFKEFGLKGLKKLGGLFHSIQRKGGGLS